MRSSDWIVSIARWQSSSFLEWCVPNVFIISIILYITLMLVISYILLNGEPVNYNHWVFLCFVWSAYSWSCSRKRQESNKLYVVKTLTLTGRSVGLQWMAACYASIVWVCFCQPGGLDMTSVGFISKIKDEFDLIWFFDLIVNTFNIT